MSPNRKPSLWLRGIALLLMALTVLFTLLGGIGTTCVAFGAENYDSMKSLVPYKTLYQVLVFTSIAAGIWGVLIIIQLVRGGKKLYRNAIIMLIIGTLTSGIQTAVSQSVRGSAAPVNIRFYISAFTLVVFLLFRLPPVWQRLEFTETLSRQSRKKISGASLIVCALITLTIYSWTKATHLSEWLDKLHSPLLASGLGMACTGIINLWAAYRMYIFYQPNLQISSESSI